MTTLLEELGVRDIRDATRPSGGGSAGADGADGIDGIDGVDGADGAILKATVTLTHAQIIHLKATPIQVIAQPGAGKMILPIAATLVADTTAGAYSGLTSKSLQLQSDTDGSAYALADALAGAGSAIDVVLGAGAKAIGVVSLAAAIPEGGNTTSGLSYGQDPTAYDNAPLYLAVVGGSGEITEGHADNTLTITVLYALVDL